MPKDISALTASEGLEILLNDYRSDRKHFDWLKEYDKSMEPMRALYESRISSVDEPLKTVAGRLFKIADESFFLNEVILWKIDYLADALDHAMRVGNPISLANNARSLVEHIATIAALGDRLVRFQREVDGQQAQKKIDDALKSCETYLRRAYYGSTRKGSKEKALHVNDLLKKLGKEVENIQEIYDHLCEFVHPNYGSNQLVSSGRLASGRLNPPQEHNREILDQLRRICSYCFLYLKNTAGSHISAPSRLQMLLDLCFVPGARIENAFSKKQARPIGDGHTKETAYYFPKARTANEAIRLTYAFFEEHGYTWIRKTIGAIEDEFIFDVHETDKGTVWVKVPKLQIG